MVALLFRTVLLYAFLGLVMRLMGKRQLAQLEMSELITTLLLSELAALPLENHDIPLLYAFVPILTLVSLEVATSVLLLRFPRLRRHNRNTPSLLICRGEIDRDELRNNRLTPEELFSALRQQGVGDPTEVEYAILEKNGTLSVLPKSDCRPTTPKDLGIKVEDDGLMHLLISDGVAHLRTLSKLNLDEPWLQRVCSAHGLRIEDVYCMMYNRTGRIIFVPCDRAEKKSKNKGSRPWKEDSCAR